MVSTNIPAGEVGEFVDLALKAKGQPVSTLSLVPPLVNTGDPDIALVQAKVAEAIDRSEGDFEAEEPAVGRGREAEEGQAQARTGGHRRLGRLAQPGVRRQPDRGRRRGVLRRLLTHRGRPDVGCR